MYGWKFIVLSCLLTGCTSQAADTSDDSTSWQGTWNLVACTWNGEPQIGNTQWIVSGDHYNIRLTGQTGSDPYHFTIDASQKRIDVFHHDTPEGTYGGKLKGIYELHEDSLKVCYDLTGERYPNSFAAGPGSKQVVYKFRRESR